MQLQCARFIKFTEQIGRVGVDSALGDQVGLCGTVFRGLLRESEKNCRESPPTAPISVHDWNCQWHSSVRKNTVCAPVYLLYGLTLNQVHFVSPECLFANNVLVTSLISCITPGVNIYEATKCILLKSPTSTCPLLIAFFQKLHFSSNARMIPVDR